MLSVKTQCWERPFCITKIEKKRTRLEKKLWCIAVQTSRYIDINTEQKKKQKKKKKKKNEIFGRLAHTTGLSVKRVGVTEL